MAEDVICFCLARTCPGFDPKHGRCIPVITALGRWRQEDQRVQGQTELSETPCVRTREREREKRESASSHFIVGGICAHL